MQIKKKALFLTIFILPLLFRCARLPEPRAKSESFALEPPTSGVFAETKKAIHEKFGEDQTGFIQTQTNKDALQWRLMLIDMAQVSIDVQTFLWHADPTGLLILERLLKAADRGVRLRLLADDLGLSANDKARVALNSHPFVNVRSFNPAANRSNLGKGVNYITRMKRMNHRMHNKLMVVDNIAAIVGGRNIGDEYFGLADKFNFSDLDVLLVGDVAEQLSKSFDIYWNSDLAFTPDSFVHGQGNMSLDELRQKYNDIYTKDKERLSEFSLEPKEWENEYATLVERFVPGTAEIVQDNPALVGEETLVDAAQGIAEFALRSKKELLVSSPYFIPSSSFYDTMRTRIENGLSVTILTNSLMTNNHTTAYGSYKGHQKRILKIGAELYELHHESQIKPQFDTPPVVSKLLGLHTKTYIMDRRYVFIGSLNWDPRSVILNTEMGVVIDSPELAEQTARMVETFMQPENAWKLSLDEKGKVVWDSSLGTRTSAASKSVFQKMGAWFYGILPIESQM